MAPSKAKALKIYREDVKADHALLTAEQRKEVIQVSDRSTYVPAENHYANTKLATSARNSLDIRSERKIQIASRCAHFLEKSALRPCLRHSSYNFFRLHTVSTSISCSQGQNTINPLLPPPNSGAHTEGCEGFITIATAY